MKNWYTTNLGKVEGPFSLSQIELKIQQKEIYPEDLIYRSGEKEWIPIKDRWQFQKIILRSRISHNKDIPKKDWTVYQKYLKQKATSPLAFQYASYSTKEVIKALHKGEISYSDWIWTEGMKEWQMIRHLPQFNHFISHKFKKHKKPVDLGQVSDTELRQSVVQAKPPSSIISSLIDTERPSEVTSSNLAKQFVDLRFYNKTPLRKNKIVMSLASLFIIVGLVMLSFFTDSSQQVQKLLSEKPFILEYNVLHNGLEIHFQSRQQTEETIQLKIKNKENQILSTNNFERNVLIRLDKNGQAILRLDHLSLPEGYYYFSGQIAEASFSHSFFIGEDKDNFAYNLSEFRRIRQEEKKKLENIKKKVMAKTIPRIPKGMKSFYGQIRELEKGYDRYHKSIEEWRIFYSSWEEALHEIDSLDLEKQSLDIGLVQELQNIEQDLKMMSQNMDQSIKEQNLKEFSLLSPQVAVFLEKVKNQQSF